MKYTIVSMLLVLTAIVLYAAGLTSGSAGTALGASLFIAGVLCEGSFWIRGLGKKSRH